MVHKLTIITPLGTYTSTEGINPTELMDYFQENIDSVRYYVIETDKSKVLIPGNLLRFSIIKIEKTK